MPAVAIRSLLLLTICLAARLSAGEAIPRPEHPRPDFQRAAWLNLNGPWQFDIDAVGAIAPADVKPDRPLGRTIVVPFCPESKLSGIGETDFMKHVMYRRTFELPAAMRGQRLLLHFGAVDWLANVWVNGRHVGQHAGGYSPFWFDITDAAREGSNEIFLSVRDDTTSGMQATGKQSQKKESHGCVYTRTTGIWQTVYLEAAGQSWLREFTLLSDVDSKRLVFQGWVAGPQKDVRLRLEALAEGKTVATDEVPAGWRSTVGVLNLPNVKLWQVGQPYLYDLRITVLQQGRPIDVVQSYFGMRKLSIDGNRFLINDRPVFQRTVLDQGFYPDGIYTAPTDAALRRDVELSQAVGFNGARLHQKVFEPRLLYWADKLGYLVWGEYPSWGVNLGKAEAVAQVALEWQEILRRDRNHPSIVGWCPLNETGSSPEIAQAQQLMALTQSIDPTRPYLDTSGYCHWFAGTDVYDSHNYNQDPTSFRAQMAAFGLTGQQPYQNKHKPQLDYAGQPYFVSEYGGTKLASSEEKGKAWGYGTAAEGVEAYVARYKGLTDVLLDNPNMFGFCYTQLTDIEQEQNGVYYYDRRPKCDPALLRAINSRPAAYETQGPRLGTLRQTTLLPTSQQSPQKWQFTFDRPADDWMQPAFQGTGWSEGPGGFGRDKTPGAVIGTQWHSADIWLRRSFELASLPSGEGMLMLSLHHDEDAEVYLNGQLIASVKGFTQQYNLVEVSAKARAALRQGKNLLAIHCHQEIGGQYIDAGLELVVVDPKR